MDTQDLLKKFILWTTLHPNGKYEHCSHCKYRRAKNATIGCPYPEKYAIYQHQHDDQFVWSLSPQHGHSQIIFQNTQCMGFLDTGNYIK